MQAEGWGVYRKGKYLQVLRGVNMWGSTSEEEMGKRLTLLSSIISALNPLIARRLSGLFVVWGFPSYRKGMRPFTSSSSLIFRSLLWPLFFPYRRSDSSYSVLAPTFSETSLYSPHLVSAAPLLVLSRVCRVPHFSPGCKKERGTAAAPASQKAGGMN